MKTIEKERTNIEKYTVYQAVDGTVFNNREECEIYENTAKGVLRGRFKKLMVCEPKNAWQLLGGYDDHSVVAVRINTELDKDVIMQTYYLDHPHLLADHNKAHKEIFEAKVEQAYSNHDLLLFGLNCDDMLYVIDCSQNIVDRLLALDKQESPNV